MILFFPSGPRVFEYKGSFPENRSDQRLLDDSPSSGAPKTYIKKVEVPSYQGTKTGQLY